MSLLADEQRPERERQQRHRHLQAEAEPARAALAHRATARLAATGASAARGAPPRRKIALSNEAEHAGGDDQRVHQLLVTTRARDVDRAAQARRTPMTSSAVTVRISDTADAMRRPVAMYGHRARQGDSEQPLPAREAERAGRVGGHRVHVLDPVEGRHQHLPERGEGGQEDLALQARSRRRGSPAGSGRPRGSGAGTRSRPRVARYSSRLEPITMPSGIASAAAMPSPSAQPSRVSPTASQKRLSPTCSPSVAERLADRREVVAREPADPRQHARTATSTARDAEPGQRPVRHAAGVRRRCNRHR